MNKVHRGGSFLFSLLMHVYTPVFRKEFTEEMHAVFKEKLAEESRMGLLHLLFVIVRESKDLFVRAFIMRVQAWKGELHPVSANTHYSRIIGLSSLILTGFILVVNPNYLFRLFSDSLGWEMVIAIILGIGLSSVFWFPSLPSTQWNSKVVTSLLLLVTIAVNALILLGPALVILLRSPIASAAPLAGFAQATRWGLLALDGLLLAIVMVLVLRGFRKLRGRSV